MERCLRWLFEGLEALGRRLEEASSSESVMRSEERGWDWDEGACLRDVIWFFDC